MAIIGFGALFDKSIEEYRKHFWLFLKVSVLLYLIPSLIIGAASLYLTHNATGSWIEPDKLSPETETKLRLMELPLNLISTAFGLLYTFTIIKILLLKRKSDKHLSVQEAIKEGSKHFWKGLLLTLLLAAALIGLFLLLIIPGIIFSVYWLFAFYALITDEAGVRQAMSLSKKAVEGRWWKVLGCILLFALIVLGITILAMIPALILSVIAGLMFQSKVLGVIFFMMLLLACQMLLMPLSLTFNEKFYQNLKENKSDIAPEKAASPK